jgi:hypothetical protein
MTSSNRKIWDHFATSERSAAVSFCNCICDCIGDARVTDRRLLYSYTFISNTIATPSSAYKIRFIQRMYFQTGIRKIGCYTLEWRSGTRCVNISLH